MEENPTFTNEESSVLEVERISFEDQPTEAHVPRSTGKWRREGVPHKGWVNIAMYDIGPEWKEIGQFCEMCEKEVIRYVQTMQHAGYPDALDVGCVCAGQMSEDYINADLRDKALRNRAARDNRAAIKAEERRIQAAAREAERRRQAVIDAENRRAAWPSKIWSVSRAGTSSYIRQDGFTLIVFKAGNKWSGSLIQVSTGRKRKLSKLHDTIDSAKLALYDGMIWWAAQEGK